VHHATFFVNSLAHTLGNTTYADMHTPRDSFITAILTLGEGYHNFHHEFPKDYRNGIRYYHYDPTKWFIRFLAFFGLTYNLHKFPENEVQKGILQMQEKVLKSAYDKLYWGPDVNQLPEITIEELKKRVEAGEQLIVIGNIVHDVSKWISHHPGGAPLIGAFIGKDATKAFNGGVYNHSNAGRNMLNSLRIAKLEESHHSAPLEESKYVVEYRLKSQ
jgi:stearoyl-CoA desaturase (delta-9 desaturase)